MFVNTTKLLKNNASRLALKRKIPWNDGEIEKLQSDAKSVIDTVKNFDVVGIVSKNIPDMKISQDMVDGILRKLDENLIKPIKKTFSGYYDLDAENHVAHLAKVIYYTDCNNIKAFANGPSRIHVDDSVVDTLFRYLMDKNFMESKSNSKKYDSIYYSIIIILSRLSNDKFNDLKNKYWSYDCDSLLKFLDIFEEIRDSIIFSVVDESLVIPFGTFKYLDKAKSQKIQTETIGLTLGSRLTDEWYEEVNSYVEILKNNGENITVKFRGKKDPMITFENYDTRKIQPIPVIYLTGTACVGKSTALNDYATVSRGDLGGFTMKGISVEQAASLNAAVNELAYMENVVGDRGTIDNVLWTWIMANIKTKPEDYVKSFVIWLENTFNEASLTRYIKELVVIIVDPNSKMNSKRMIARGSGGDADRGRINSYPTVQSFAFFAFARLVGWFVEQTQYNNGIWVPDYSEIRDTLKKYLEFKKGYLDAIEPVVKKFKPNSERVMFCIPATTPCNYSVLSYAHAKALNIFK